MLGGDRHRLAEAEPVGLDQAGRAGAALAFVRGQHDRLRDPPQHVGEVGVERRDPGAGVDQHQQHVGLVDGACGLDLHAAGQRLPALVLEPRGVDRLEGKAQEAPLALAAVAGHAGRRVHQGLAAADEAVEKGRLADIGPPDDGDGERHHLSASSSASSVSRNTVSPATAGGMKTASGTSTRPSGSPV